MLKVGGFWFSISILWFKSEKSVIERMNEEKQGQLRNDEDSSDETYKNKCACANTMSINDARYK